MAMAVRVLRLHLLRLNGIRLPIGEFFDLPTGEIFVRVCVGVFVRCVSGRLPCFCLDIDMPESRPGFKTEPKMATGENKTRIYVFVYLSNLDCESSTREQPSFPRTYC